MINTHCGNTCMKTVQLLLEHHKRNSMFLTQIRPTTSEPETHSNLLYACYAFVTILLSHQGVHLKFMHQGGLAFLPHAKAVC